MWFFFTFEHSPRKISSHSQRNYNVFGGTEGESQAQNAIVGGHGASGKFTLSLDNEDVHELLYPEETSF